MAAYYRPGDQLIVTLDSLTHTGLTSRHVTITSRQAPGRFLVADSAGNQLSIHGADLLPNTAQAREYVGRLEKYVKLGRERDEAMEQAGRKIADDYEETLKALSQEIRTAGRLIPRPNPYRR